MGWTFLPREARENGDEGWHLTYCLRATYCTLIFS